MTISSAFVFLCLSLLPASLVAATSAVCPSARCGDAVDVRYPFWIGSGMGGADTNWNGTGTGSMCGYPALRLECRGGTAVLQLPSGEYGVTKILYGDNGAGDRTVALFDLRVAMSRRCPMVAGRNLTLPAGSPPPLSLADQDANLTFMINCPFKGVGPQSQVPCLDTPDGMRHTYVFGDTAFALNYGELCDAVVGMPVLKNWTLNSTGPLELDSVIMPALRGGFELRWRQALGGECGECEERGGFCGQRRDTFACINTSASDPAACAHARAHAVVLPLFLAFLGFLLGEGRF